MGMVAIANIAALRQVSPNFNEAVFVMGASTPNDGGAGMYVFSAGDTTPDNGTTRIQSQNGVGCWFLNLANSSQGSDPDLAPYVTAESDSRLPSSRVLTAGSNITITDNKLAKTITVASTGGASLIGTTNSATPFLTVLGSSGANNATGINNTTVGYNAGNVIGSSTDNSLFGYQAGLLATGNNNAVFGSSAGDGITSGARNSFFGKDSGGSVSSGAMSDASAFGYQSGLINTADQNSFFGSACGASNTSGTGQAFFGYQAANAAIGNNNSVFGHQAGDAFTTGANNCLFGKDAGGGSGGSMTDSCFFGYQAGLVNNANQNTLIGSGSGKLITSGSNNVLIGYNTSVAATETRSVAIGASAVSVTDSIAIGNQATTAGNVSTFVAGSSGSPINSVYFGTGIAFSSPQVVSINGSGGSGSDIAGADLQLAGGKGTGVASPGLVVLKYPLRTTTGSALQSLSTQSFPISTTMFVGNTADVTVIASTVNTTETTLRGTTISGGATLEGGLIRVGRAIRVTIGGLITTSAVPVTIRIRIKIGSIAIADTGAVTPTANVTNGAFNVYTTAICRAIGASGTFTGSGNSIVGAAIGTQAFTMQVTSTVDTTTSANMDMTITYGGNTAGNQVTVGSILCEILN